MAEGYLVPAGEGAAEMTEKRSRFLGRVWRVEREAEAMCRLRETRAKYHDARHHCWCYLLSDGGKRCSDDGEPQGTAGQPMLELFERQGVSSVCCVVTRYFGGILLGPGGLARAYTQTAKDALRSAGIARSQKLRALEIFCPYPLFERVKVQLAACGGTTEEIEYGESVRLAILLRPDAAGAFCAALTELSGGTVAAADRGEVFRTVPVPEGELFL